MQTQQSLFESELKKLINIAIEEFANEARDKSDQRSR
jgi:hypothetical protein